MDSSKEVYSVLILGFMFLLMIVQAIGLIHRFWAERISLSLEWSLVRLLIPTLILCAFLSIRSGFPGASAPVEVRQQWAMKEFRDFNDVTKAIQRCPGIVDRIGQVKFVAPTDGRNYVFVEGGSGYHGEMTLEVVGDRATEAANLRIHLGSITSAGIQFTYAGETENLKCF